MSTHTISDVQKADDLWDEMPLPDVATALDIPLGTLRGWAHKGMIATDTEHQHGTRKHSETKVDLADALWDLYPLPQVADLIDVPEGTLRTWSYKGWISTNTDHNRDPEMADKIRRTAQLVYIQGNTQRRAAEILDFAESTVSRRLKRYRLGNY